MTIGRAPMCMGCKYRRPDGPGFACDAFPGGIPEAIYNSRADHRQAYEGDNGIQFDPETQEAADYAAELFPTDGATGEGNAGVTSTPQEGASFVGTPGKASFAYNPAEKRDWHGRWSKLSGQGGGDYKEYKLPLSWDDQVELAMHYKPWAKTVTPEESQAIGNYQAIGYRLLNTYARTGKVETDSRKALTPAGWEKGDKEQNIKDAMRHIDDALGRDGAVAPRNMLVFRSGKPVDEDGNAYWELGELLVDKGYVSTTLDPSHAGTFRGVLMAIEVPRGSRGVYLDAIPSPGEKEMLLPRGSVFTRVGDYQLDGYDANGNRQATAIPRLRYLGTASKRADLAKFSSPASGAPKQEETDGERFVWETGDLERMGVRVDVSQERPTATETGGKGTGSGMVQAHVGIDVWRRTWPQIP